jgi:phage gp36-like protein
MAASKPYAVAADLVNYGVMATSTFGGLSQGQMQAALDAANALADGYLAARFKLPLIDYGKDLTENVIAIARFKLLTQRGFAPQGDAAAAIVEAKKDAIRWFEGVAAGTINPTVTDSSSGGVVGGLFVEQGVADSENPGRFVVGKPTGRDW